MTGDEPTDAEHRISYVRRLGAACNGHPELVGGALPLVLEALRDENRPDVLVAAADALGDMWDPRCLEPLLALSEHERHEVRLAVARALTGALTNNETDAGIASVIRLSRDVEPSVRDWATFALAHAEADSAEVRAALWERVQSEDGDAAGEALVGLAQRHDGSVRDRILELLMDDPGNLIVEAAGALADPAFLPLLLHLRDQGWAERDVRGAVLAEAIAACDVRRR